MEQRVWNRFLKQARLRSGSKIETIDGADITRRKNLTEWRDGFGPRVGGKLAESNSDGAFRYVTLLLSARDGLVSPVIEGKVFRAVGDIRRSAGWFSWKVESWILSMGTHATVIRPEALRDRLSKAPRELVARYRVGA